MGNSSSEQSAKGRQLCEKRSRTQMDFLQSREKYLMEMPNYVRKIATIQVQSSNSAVVAIGYYGEVGGSRFRVGER
jgi:hypothetical protein